MTNWPLAEPQLVTMLGGQMRPGSVLGFTVKVVSQVVRWPVWSTMVKLTG